MFIQADLSNFINQKNYNKFSASKKLFYLNTLEI